MKELKVVTVVGTRPEIIRLARVLPALDEHTQHTLIHTGQNYDYELSEIFFDDLGLRPPDNYLNIETATLGGVLADIIRGVEKCLIEIQPDAFLVLGDTNSAISLLVAKRMKIPTFHMEAGNRSFDSNVPEEVNRKMVDHLSDFNLVYTEHARRNLRAEGIADRFIYKTGSPMREVLGFYREKIEKSNILQELNLKRHEYVIVSVHREENIDDNQNLISVVTCLNQIQNEFQFPVIVSTHPRTFSRLEGLGDVQMHDGIQLLKPFSFTDYNKLQLESFCAISDSGTISEEASILGFPAVTLRSSMERPEALDTGSIVITGLDPDAVVRCVKVVTSSRLDRDKITDNVPQDYLINNTSERVLRLISGLALLTPEWKNMRKFSRYKHDV